MRKYPCIDNKNGVNIHDYEYKRRIPMRIIKFFFKSFLLCARATNMKTPFSIYADLFREIVNTLISYCCKEKYKSC